MPAAVGSCPRLTPPPADLPLALPAHGLWSRHILQQTLMDEGLRLARLVSHDRVGRLSPCVPAKPALAGEAASSAVPKHPTPQAPLGDPGVLGPAGRRRAGRWGSSQPGLGLRRGDFAGLFPVGRLHPLICEGGARGAGRQKGGQRGAGRGEPRGTEAWLEVVPVQAGGAGEALEWGCQLGTGGAQRGRGMLRVWTERGAGK